MSDKPKPVDVLFIVPDSKFYLWKRAIKFILWVFEINKTFGVMSADDFVVRYRHKSVEEMDTSLTEKCVAMVNTFDISEREWKEFQPLQQKIHNYWEDQKKVKQ